MLIRLLYHLNILFLVFLVYDLNVVLNIKGLLTEGFFWIPSLAGPTTIAARQSGSGISWLFPFVVSKPCLIKNHFHLDSNKHILSPCLIKNHFYLDSIIILSCTCIFRCFIRNLYSTRLRCTLYTSVTLLKYSVLLYVLL